MKKLMIILLMSILITITPPRAQANDLNTDKVLHVSAGALTYSVADYFYSDRPMRYVVAVGVSKELYDHFSGGNVELADVGYTIIGGILADWVNLRVKF